MEYKTNEQGEMLVYPLELPMYDGDSRALGQTASVNLTSALRHFAVVDAIGIDGLEDPNQENQHDIFDRELDIGSQQLISVMIALASLADLYGIDIMQEIYEIPWNV